LDISDLQRTQEVFRVLRINPPKSKESILYKMEINLIQEIDSFHSEINEDF